MTQAWAIKSANGTIGWISVEKIPDSELGDGITCVEGIFTEGSAEPVGEWTACGNILMNADDLYDVKITVDGNWPDDRHRATFMHRVAKLLNAPPADDARRLLERVNAIFVEMRGSVMDRVRLAEDIHNHLARSGK